MKSEKNDLGHIMISYNHSTKIVCAKIARYLRVCISALSRLFSNAFFVFSKETILSGLIKMISPATFSLRWHQPWRILLFSWWRSMKSIIKVDIVAWVRAPAVLLFMWLSLFACSEAEYSIEQNKASIPMLMQTGYKALGWLGIINGSKLHIDFSQMAFEEAFHLLVREIEAVRIGLGAERNDRAGRFHRIMVNETGWSFPSSGYTSGRWNGNNDGFNMVASKKCSWMDHGRCERLVAYRKTGNVKANGRFFDWEIASLFF